MTVAPNRDKLHFSDLVILNLIKELPGNKATVSDDMPVSVLKELASVYHEKLTDIFNNCIRSGTFSETLKKLK